MKFTQFILVFGALAFSAPITLLAAPNEIRMATTTSTEASGLLGALLPQFEKNSGIRVRVIAVGTGQALKLGERGDVDVVLVHSRVDEDKFMADGFGSARYDVMYNDFVVVGPANDPAAIKQRTSAAAALAAIAGAREKFVSRGDDSGTHKKELSLWKEARTTPSGAWYVSAGQGMGEVLTMAGNMRAYTLTDRATFLAYRGKVGLEVIVSERPGLFNPYGVMPINPAKHPHVNHVGATQFAKWLVSPGGREAIRALKVDGVSLFTPGAPPA